MLPPDWKIFPCLPGSKEPATPHGFKDASADPHQIAAWKSEWPGANWAVACGDSGLCVVDIDGPVGESAWLDLQIEHGFPADTLEVKTPRGGRHIYFRGLSPSSVQKIGQKVDIRSAGGYALLPGSTFDGRPYTFTSTAAVQEAPPWLLTAAGRTRDRVKAPVDVDLDQPQNIARAAAYLRAAVPAIEGMGGDSRTYQVCAELLDLGVSEDRALALLEEHWNPRCEPPWEPEDLTLKIERASAYKQNEPGAWAVGSTQEVFGEALGKLAPEDLAPARPSRFRAWELEELAALPPPSWLVPEMIPDKGLSLFYGPGDSYKTFLVLDIGLALARAGKTVLYLAGEGGVGAYQRIAAWKLAHDVERLREFKVVREMPWASDGGMLTEFLEENRKHRPDLIIVDTAARMMFGLNENDARDMGTLVMALDTIKRQFDCAVVAIHHTGKDVTKGARGSDALLYATDAAFEVQADVKVKAAAIHCRRQKDAKRRETPWTFEGREVAGSLVFQPISASEHRRLTTADDEIAAKKVGAVLVRLGARGLERAVTTHVLALEMVENGLSDEQKAEAVSRLSGLLSRRASGPLEAYATGKGAGLKWFVP